MLRGFQNDFSSRFVDVILHKKSFCLFENPFSIDENDVDSSIRLKLIELKTETT